MKIIIPVALAAVVGAAAFTGYRFIRNFIPQKEAPVEGKKHILCIGDSITFGMGVYKNRETEAWPYLLNILLGDDFQVLNYGISGATLLRSGNQPYKQDFLDVAIQANAELYLIMLGTNDSKPYNWKGEQFERELLAWIETIRTEDSHRDVVLMMPPKAFPIKKGKVAFDISNDTISGELYQIILRVAEREKVPLIDLYALTSEHPEFFGDGVHPNTLGNQVIAQHIYEKLKLMKADQ